MVEIPGEESAVMDRHLPFFDAFHDKRKMNVSSRLIGLVRSP